MNKKLLALLVGVVCLAPSFARAQSSERDWSKVVDDSNIQEVIKNSRVSTVGQRGEAATAAAATGAKYDACSARPGLAEHVTNDLESYENAVVSAAIDSEAGPTVAHAAKTIANYTASNNGQCVDKTIIVYLQNRGYDAVSDVRISETRDSVALVSATSGVLLYGPSEIEAYATRTYGGYLRGVADARDGGTDRLKRMCAKLASMPYFSSQNPVPDYCKALLNN
ncbi:MAG: hypothetical protein ACHQ2Z_06675 [Elusimicrobiota bacterium]